VFILYHPVTPSVDRAAREAQAYAELREKFESMVVLIWLGKPFPPPSAEVRAALAAGFAAGPPVEAVAWIVDSDRSLSSSVVHSVSTQLFPRTSKTRVFRDPFDAAGWLTTIEGTDPVMIIDGLDALDQAQPA
jgi:hypothetical protein